MAAQENHSEVVKFLLANNASQTLATEVSDFVTRRILAVTGKNRLIFIEIGILRARSHEARKARMAENKSGVGEGAVSPGCRTCPLTLFLRRSLRTFPLRRFPLLFAYPDIPPMYGAAECKLYFFVSINRWHIWSNGKYPIYYKV